MKFKKKQKIDIDFILHSPERFIKLLKEESHLLLKEENGSSIISIKSTEEELNVKQQLDKVGMQLFIEFYDVFKDYEDAWQYLPYKYSLASRRARSSAARNIFKNNKQEEALKEAYASYKLDISYRSMALDILKKEGFDANPFVPLRTGYMARHLLPVLLDRKSSEYIKQFEDLNPSKEVFSLYYPMLLEMDPFDNPNKLKQDKNKYPRYYAKPITIKGNLYLLCSQWMEKVQTRKFSHFAANELVEIYKERCPKQDKSIEKVLQDLTPYISECIHSIMKELLV
jgi:hypothetical protein